MHLRSDGGCIAKKSACFFTFPLCGCWRVKREKASEMGLGSDLKLERKVVNLTLELGELFIICFWLGTVGRDEEGQGEVQGGRDWRGNVIDTLSLSQRGSFRFRIYKDAG